MHPISQIVQTFFEHFERASNTFEGDLLASQFSDPFISADPDGHIQVVKKDDFIAGIAKRQAFFQSIGFRFVKIVLLDALPMDDHYVMAKVHTQMRFEKEAGTLIDLENDATYILFIKNDSPRIVFYTTHEDLAKIMQSRGL